MKKCIHCGYELDDIAIFCSECGKSQEVHKEVSDITNTELTEKDKKEATTTDAVIKETSDSEDVSIIDTVNKKDLKNASVYKIDISEKNDLSKENSSATTAVKSNFFKSRFFPFALAVVLFLALAVMIVLFIIKANEYSKANDKITDLQGKYEEIKENLDESEYDNETLRNNYLDLYDKYEDLSDENDDLLDDMFTYLDKVDFLDKNIRFVIDGGVDGKYHTYDCPKFENCATYRAGIAKGFIIEGFDSCDICNP